jgi:hypothetical protein
LADIVVRGVLASAHPSLNKFKKVGIISSIFSDHNGMKLKISNRRKTENFTNMWKLNNTLNN